MREREAPKRKRGAPISHIVEDYLKAIYHLEQEHGSVTARQIAREMGVGPSSVTNMLQKLARLRLIHYAPYRSVGLTPPGRKVALEVIRHHRLLELFLQEVLGYRLARVHEEAERLEHTISEELEERIADVLGHPLLDPHGSPIPRRDGSMVERRQVPLTEAADGRPVVVSQLLSRDPEQLQYLEGIGLTPQAQVQVLEKRPLAGPLSLRIGPDRLEVIGHDLARQVLVDPRDPEDG
jgi:DtxR family Mn-dependent transcriptional regulator